MNDYLLKTQPLFIKQINNAYHKNRLNQIYLFTGIKGTPKKAGAYYLASLLLCEDENEKPCYNCHSCNNVAKNSHPRLYQIESQGDSIKKEQIEKLEKEFSMSGLEKGNRVFIIEDIDKATPSAANSLLKFLEEMHEGNYGILLTDNLQAVISTIRSRANIITFRSMPSSLLALEYQKKGIDVETSRIMSIITNNTEEGMNIIAKDYVCDIFDLVRTLTIKMFENRDLLLIMNEKGKFMFDLTNKELHNIFIDLMISITYDRLYYILGQKEQIIFQETLNQIENIDDIGYNQTYHQITKLLECKKRMQYNVNPELLYMDMLIEMRYEND